MLGCVFSVEHRVGATECKVCWICAYTFLGELIEKKEATANAFEVSLNELLMPIDSK